MVDIMTGAIQAPGLHWLHHTVVRWECRWHGDISNWNGQHTHRNYPEFMIPYTLIIEYHWVYYASNQDIKTNIADISLTTMKCMNLYETETLNFMGTTNIPHRNLPNEWRELNDPMTFGGMNDMVATQQLSAQQVYSREVWLKKWTCSQRFVDVEGLIVVFVFQWCCCKFAIICLLCVLGYLGIKDTCIIGFRALYILYKYLKYYTILCYTDIPYYTWSLLVQLFCLCSVFTTSRDPSTWKVPGSFATGGPGLSWNMRWFEDDGRFIVIYRDFWRGACTDVGEIMENFRGFLGNNRGKSSESIGELWCSVTYCIDSGCFFPGKMLLNDLTHFTEATMTFIHEDWSILDERSGFRSFEMCHVGMILLAVEVARQMTRRVDLCMMRLQCLCEWRWIPSRHGWTFV